MELVDIGLLLIGLVLVFFGAALSIYAVALLGFLIGAGGGYVLAPTLLGAFGAEGLVGFAVAIIVGGLLGAGLAYVALSFATAIPAFVVGAFVGLHLGIEFLGAESLLRFATMGLGGLVGSVLGFTLTKFALIFISAFVGAAFASRSVTVENFQNAQASLTPEPLLFDPLAPIFLGLFALGVLSQFGLFKLGWVAKIGAVLPGIGRVVGNSDES